MTDPEIIIYTDGSSRGNPGPGGYGIIMKDCKSGYIKEYSKGFKLTTNNRMELMAVIDALKKVKKGNFVANSSRYELDGLTPSSKQQLTFFIFVEQTGLEPVTPKK